jgi:ferredoxin
MEKAVYRRLAQRLDTIPNGFPATPSGVELRLLAKIFTPQQAALASEMKLAYEPAEKIATRADVDPKQAYRTLKGMARQGLIRVRRGDEGLVFALLPFVVGIYEEQLPHLDAELAALAEAYFREIAGRTILDAAPPIHRVIPVAEAVPFDLEVFPHERATELVESARSWGVRNCICRVQQRLLGEGCDHPLESCLVLAPIEDAFHEEGPTRPIDKAEALEILQEAAASGLVHSTGNFRDRHYYICNCCSCCCAVLRGVVEFDVPTAVARSGFRSAVDAEACTGCGACIERCPFGALSLPEAVCVVDATRCLGCGVCVPTCPSDALHLERLPAEEIPTLPTDLRDWAAQRAAARGQSIEDLF